MRSAKIEEHAPSHQEKAWNFKQIKLRFYVVDSFEPLIGEFTFQGTVVRFNFVLIAFGKYEKYGWLIVTPYTNPRSRDGIILTVDVP